MDKYVLSEYFQKNNTINVDHTIYNKMVSEKNIRSKQSTSDTNRSICQMVRDMNVSTNLKYEIVFCQIIYYIDTAVRTLISYKDNWIEYLRNDSKSNISRGRSLFSDNKRDEAKLYLNIDHIVFRQFKNLYNSVDDANMKNLVLECVYYTQRIDLKFKFYENDVSARRI